MAAGEERVDDWEKFSRIDLEVQVSPEILSRGLSYYHDGHLLQAVRVGMTRAGVLAGTAGNYRVRLWFEDGVLQTFCTCPFQGFCKHMAAVAVAWLTDPALFIDLQPELDRMTADPSLLRETVVRLCHQEPFVFRELLVTAPAPLEFHSARGILNLIRNIFANPRESLGQSSEIWEKIKRLQELLRMELRRGSAEALLPLVELMKGLAAVYLDYPTERLTDSFNELIAVLRELPPGLPEAVLEPVLETLFLIYFEPKLWEWKQSCGMGVKELAERLPHTASNFLGMKLLPEKQLPELPTLELVSLYELLLVLKPGTAAIGADLAAVEQALKERGEGLLWLVDRWLDDVPDFSFRLANDGLRRLEPGFKFQLWDRLVKLHCRRGELKQAAALSFALFRKEPSFEEYLRLKEILRDRPAALQEYCLKATRFLKSRWNPENGAPSLPIYRLLIKIAVLDGDSEAVREYCAASRQTPEILHEIAKLCWQEPSGVWLDVCPDLIRFFLADDTPEIWRNAHRLLIMYKKICFQDQRQTEWNSFSREIYRQYEADRRFRKKFGALLNLDSTEPDDDPKKLCRDFN